ncbi:Deoxyuridine 5'-triphosphate nucleotidohydrolase [Astathelohania contejeani]|uniref:Deoxyuridine 5'-triphosphate nucleotidohydrolase n=1 Tax=Astathelohania contejeani TaxID=164912 RepID=A0ABQ7I2M4_9MICR|nr:Deoxyuridine 5'-triphosphate nucleotidohydrolase [Thelohania contejeani]
MLINNFKVFKIDKNTKTPAQQCGGYILYANIDGIIKPNETFLVPTGIKLSFNSNFFAHIIGISNKHDLKVLGGVVDSDYRGEVKVIIYNGNKIDFAFKKHDPIGLLTFTRIATPNLQLID